MYHFKVVWWFCCKALCLPSVRASYRGQHSSSPSQQSRRARGAWELRGRWRQLLTWTLLLNSFLWALLNASTSCSLLQLGLKSRTQTSNTVPQGLFFKRKPTVYQAFLENFENHWFGSLVWQHRHTTRAEGFIPGNMETLWEVGGAGTASFGLGCSSSDSDARLLEDTTSPSW